MNLNLHLHSLVLDGVHTRPTPDAAPVFHPLPPPTDEEIGKVLERVHERVQKLLRRRGRLPEEPSPSDPVAEQMPLLAGSAAASIQERAATGPRGGYPVRRLRSAAAVVDGDTPRCAPLEGFSLHANVALPGRDGSTHLLVDPLELIEKLSVLILLAPHGAVTLCILSSNAWNRGVV